MDKWGPKYIQKLCDGICHLNFKLEVTNPNLKSGSTTKIDKNTLRKIKALTLEDEYGDIVIPK